MNLRWLRTVRLGLKSLLLHKLRSGLTALGIIFGVCSVIAMLAIGEGASYEAQQQIKSLGAANIIVRSVKPPQESATVNADSRVLHYGLTYDDFDRCAATVPSVVEALPVRELLTEFRQGQRAMDGRAVATTPAYQKINNLKLHHGRFLTPLDLRRYENVAVLAYEVAHTLFPLRDPVGGTIKVQRDYYRVIGVCEPRSAAAAIGRDLAAQEFDKDVYIPLTTARIRYGDLQGEVRSSGQNYERTQLRQFTLVLAGPDAVRPTATVVRDLLAHAHQHEDYAVTVPLELLEQAERTKRLFNVVLGSVGAISLLVGGIGIMNIMLATVTERTREIGIRRALGAKRGDVTAQFLVEAVVLSSLGGLLGLALGVGLAYLVERGAALAGVPLPGRVTLFGQDVRTRWVIAGVSGGLLVVAGLGVFVRRAARRGLSLLRLLEGLALTAGGGLVGVLVGVGLPYMITDLVTYFFDYSVPTIVNPWSLLLAFGISVMIGIVFGMYPARRAALMDPIEALRHE